MLVRAIEPFHLRWLHRLIMEDRILNGPVHLSLRGYAHFAHAKDIVKTSLVQNQEAMPTSQIASCSLVMVNVQMLQAPLTAMLWGPQPMQEYTGETTPEGRAGWATS